MRWSCGSRTHVSFPLIKLAKKLKVLGAVAMEELKGFLFPLIKLAKKLKDTRGSSLLRFYLSVSIN